MEKVPYTGFRSAEAPEALSHHLPLPRGFGLLVTEVAKESPAGKAGIQRHDILLQAGDQRLVNPGQLRALVRAQKPGDSMGFRLFRAGKEWEVQLILWEAEEPELEREERPPVFGERGGPPVRRPGENVRRVDGPVVDLSKSAAFSRELLEKTERLGEEALRIFREFEPFQFPPPPPAPAPPPPPAAKPPGRQVPSGEISVEKAGPPKTGPQ
jgi:hypothetical protein